MSFDSQRSSRDRRAFWTSVLLCWLVLLFASFGRVPVPDGNEPQYLGKALHFWDSSYCPDDLFMASANVHTVFYIAVGWIASSWGLWWAAVLGRTISLACVALGWSMWVSRLSPRIILAPASLLLFAEIQFLGSLAGEWVIGGVEGKVFAYGALFGAAGLACSGHYRRASLLAGVGAAFHPVIGMWSVVCGGGAVVASSTFERGREVFLLRGLKELVICAGLFLAVSSPGWIPAVLLVAEPVDAATQQAADLVQVFDRLDHHLDPMGILLSGWAIWGALAAVALGLMWGHRQDLASRWSAWLLMFSIGVAAAGLLIGLRFGPPHEMPGLVWRQALLKLYWFRLADTLAPVLFSIAISREVIGRLEQSTARARMRVAALAGLATLGLLLFWVQSDHTSMRRDPVDEADFRAMGQWIQANTDPSATFVSSREARGFKWHAMRSEYFAFKDAPQDAPGLVEWSRRRRLVKAWRREARGEDGYALASLEALRERTGADYLLEHRDKRYPLEPAWQVGRYRVFDLAALPSSRPSEGSLAP
jgi:hypothetical protein